MTTWTSDQLTRIAAAEELEIASLRPDGTLRKPTTIWVIRHHDDLYVRSVNGRTAAWFRGTQERHQGHIKAGGVNQDVTFVEVEVDTDPDLSAHIDAAYRTKYHRYAKSIVDSIVTPKARAATIKLVPSPTGT